MSYAESWPLKLNCRDLAIGADPVGPFIRSQIGSYGLAMVASYAPASLSPVLTLAEKTHVTKAIRGSVLDHVRHWLRPYVDRPQHARLMSRRAFHEAVERILASTESAPDVDAIYALLAFREFDISWFGMRHMKAPTPLFSAAQAAHAGVVRLLLEHRATPDGFQRSYVCHRFHRYECLVETTPLWAAVKESWQTSSAIHVVRMLMQARADPDACGEKEDVVHWGHARGGLDSEMYVLRRSPLYGAVQLAKGCSKKRERGIVHLLLRHGARPERVGAIHYRLKRPILDVTHEPIRFAHTTTNALSMFARAGLNDAATLDLLRSTAQPLASSSSDLVWDQSICDPDQRVLDRWDSYLTGFDLTGFDASDDEYPQYSDDSS